MSAKSKCLEEDSSKREMEMEEDMELAKSTHLEEDSSKLEMEMGEDTELAISTRLEEDSSKLDMEIENVESTKSTCLGEDHWRRTMNFINFHLVTSAIASRKNLKHQRTASM